MQIFFLQQLRLSYAQPVLPLFRTMLAGGVLAILALLVGFVAPAPSTLARPLPPARGPLIEADQHPEWKQFLVQAAYRRADELGQLRTLPSAPTLTPVATPTVPVQVAELPPAHAEIEPEEITGAIDDAAPGSMSIDIGEASATELPVQQLELPMPIERPETLKRNQSQLKTPARHITKRKPAPAKPEPDFLTRIFGGDSTAPATNPTH
jgi:hypothetical protein